jgi:hypothetical protein
VLFFEAAEIKIFSRFSGTYKPTFQRNHMADRKQEYSELLYKSGCKHICAAELIGVPASAISDWLMDRTPLLPHKQDQLIETLTGVLDLVEYFEGKYGIRPDLRNASMLRVALEKRRMQLTASPK